MPVLGARCCVLGAGIELSHEAPGTSLSIGLAAPTGPAPTRGSTTRRAIPSPTAARRSGRGIGSRLQTRRFLFYLPAFLRSVLYWAAGPPYGPCVARRAALTLP